MDRHVICASCRAKSALGAKPSAGRLCRPSGDADKNLDWLNSDAQAVTMLAALTALRRSGQVDAQTCAPPIERLGIDQETQAPWTW